jgi:hypothetical protein
MLYNLEGIIKREFTILCAIVKFEGTQKSLTIFLPVPAETG